MGALALPTLQIVNSNGKKDTIKFGIDLGDSMRFWHYSEPKIAPKDPCEVAQKS